MHNIMDPRHGSLPGDKSDNHGHVRSYSPTARALRDIAFGSVSHGFLALEMGKILTIF